MLVDDMLHEMLVWVLLLMKLVASSKDAFIFNGFSRANLTLNGLAEITSGGLVKLTNNSKEAEGHAFYPASLPFKNSSDGKVLSFSTSFVFAIVAEYPDVSGHGIAFALSPSKELPGAMPSQHLGLFNSSSNGNATNHILAIEFDTVKTVEFEDINDNHVGIDINDLRSFNSSSAAYFDGTSGRFQSLKLISGEPMQVWIDYDGASTQLDATISPVGIPKPRIPLLSSKVNLSSIILDDMFVGFSSSTGSATGSHYILGWSFSLNSRAQTLDLSLLPQLPRQGTAKKRPNAQALAVGLPLAAIILLAASVTVVILLRRRKRRFAELLEGWELEYGPHRFSYKDLYRATKGFSEENQIGVGGFGQVYRGVLRTSGNEIAVKKISHDSRQGMREFIAEIASMGRLRHRNLVQLHGYCRREGELLLVYEFMANSSLDKLLFQDTGTTLTWSQRFWIIKGVASGLLYLHEGWEQVVIHRDIKASNVLLDRDFNGKLGDFGLARLHDHGANPHTTHIVGTLGYLAPELSKTGKATTNTDVYAFGAFLLEVACGRRPIELQASVQEPGLLDWVLECWKKGEILSARDPKLATDIVAEEMELVLKLGLYCSHPEPLARPSMKQVVQFLEGDASLPSMTPDHLSAPVFAREYYESFEEFIMSYPSMSVNTSAACSTSPPFTASR